MRLIGYVRVSKTNKRLGKANFQSPAEQRRAITNIVALTPGAEVVDWIEEFDESGGTMDRPGVKRAIRAVDNGDADGIVMAYLSRWARTPTALEKIEQWSKEGKVFLSAAERIDTTTSHGMFALGVLLLVAKLDLDRHRETWADSTRNAVERGVAIRVPYGYARGDDGRLVAQEPQASVVRLAFRLRADGVGIAQIARELDAGGIGPAHAKAWTRQSVRALLRVRTYMGEVHYADTTTLDAHEAIIDSAAWEAAQIARGPAMKPRSSALLTGIVRCGGCGYSMGAGMTNGHRRYNCNRHHGGGNCPSPTSALAGRLERFVVGRFLERYSTVPVGSAQADAGLISLERNVDAARREFETWRDDTEMREMIGDADYRAGMRSRHARLAAAQAAHAAAVREKGAATLTVDMATWDDLTTAERALLLRAGIEYVALRRASSTRDPIEGRCVIVWVGERPVDDHVVRGVASDITPL